MMVEKEKSSSTEIFEKNRDHWTPIPLPSSCEMMLAPSAMHVFERKQ
jgi:hypothetical protein